MLKNIYEVMHALATLLNNAESDFEKLSVDRLIQALTNPPQVEVIDDKHQKFNGLTYHKGSSGHFLRRDSIYQDVWTYYNGNIPDGDYHIHHKNMNKDDNQLENLLLLTNSEHRKLHNKANMTEFICAWCGKKFRAPNVGNNKFCSAQCRDAHQKDKDTVIRICEYCGKEFPAVKKSKTRFCSNSCGQLSRYVDIPNKGNHYEERTCENCGKKFSVYKYDKTRFCSCSCAQKVLKKDCREDRTCPICGTTFTIKKSSPKKCCSLSCARKLDQMRRHKK